jgi:hypothetical protein
MMRKTSVVVIGCFLTACPWQALDSSSVQAQSGDGASPTSGQIILIEPKGSLKVIQAKGQVPVEATKHMLVSRGNLLILDAKAKATVLCGGKPYKLGPGFQPCPCTEPCRPEDCGIIYDGSRISSTRGPDTENSPYPVVISPRKTLVLNPRPAIRWTPISGANEDVTYKVILYGENMRVIWTRDVNGQTALAYPDKEPSLTPGHTYKVVVTAKGRSSDEDHSPGLGFTVLAESQRRALADEETKRRKLGLPEPQTRFLTAILYAGRELYSEAIEQLNELHATMREPAVARVLGDLHLLIGLNREAEKKYLEALKLQDPTDLEGMGLIQKNLAQAYENLGIFDHAIARLQEAIKAYERLGNSVVEQLKKQEQSLKRY